MDVVANMASGFLQPSSSRKNDMMANLDIFMVVLRVIHDCLEWLAQIDPKLAHELKGFVRETIEDQAKNYIADQAGNVAQQKIQETAEQATNRLALQGATHLTEAASRGLTGATARGAQAFLVGLRGAPVVGNLAGGILAGQDTMDAARQGQTGRAVLSGLETTLYGVAATSGTAAAFNIWNPAGWGAGLIALGTGGAALTITAGKAIYDNAENLHGKWHDLQTWFYDKPAPETQIRLSNQSANRGASSLRAMTSGVTRDADAYSPRKPVVAASPDYTPAV